MSSDPARGTGFRFRRGLTSGLAVLLLLSQPRADANHFRFLIASGLFLLLQRELKKVPVVMAEKTAASGLAREHSNAALYWLLVLQLLWQVFDIFIHIRAEQVSVEHVAANVVVIGFVVLTCGLVFCREDAAEYPFWIATVSGAGYLSCMVWYLSGHLSTSGPMVWILMAGWVIASFGLRCNALGYLLLRWAALRSGLFGLYIV